MSDIFREVEEDLRRARYRHLWERFGAYVIGLAVLIVVGTAAWRGYEYWQERQAAASGDRYIEAISIANGGDHAAAAAAFAAIQAEGNGSYPMLARLRAASERALAGENDAAVAEFDAIAASSSTPPGLQAIARMRSALILADTLDLAQMRARIGDLAESGQAFRHAARDLLGMVAWRTQDYAGARGYFTQVLEDETAPTDLRQRAALMADLIDSRIGAAADG